MENNRNEEIEKIAWQVFQDKLGLSFKRELTPEEKSGITEVMEYDVYRNEATKIYERRLRKKALHKTKYPIIDVPANGKPNWYEGAYTLCFVYSKHKGNFILRGWRGEVMEYLKKNYTHYICYISMWHNGFSRGHWKFWKENSVSIFEPTPKSKYRKTFKFTVVKYDNDKRYDEDGYELARLNFKRMPHRWIPEFDKLS